MEVRKIGVLGAGLMGSGIVQAAASNGYEVIMVDITDDLVNRGLASIEKSLNRFVERGGISAEQQVATRERITATSNLEELADVDLIIEAIIENLGIKRDTFGRLDKLCKPETIFASNTSSLSITDILTAVSPERQKRFVGMHFFNPVQIMKLLEVVRTIVTAPDALATASEVGRKMGKTVVTAQDTSGFIVNRLLVPYLLDAIRALEQGLASTVDIDNGMKLGCAHPMGPLTLSDFIGLDTIYYIGNIMFDEFREQRFAPPSLLKRMVTAGLLGRKSGKGFYDYTDPANPIPMSLV